MKRAYVITSEHAGTKVGVSDNPARRAADLMAVKSRGACAVYFQTAPRHDAYLVESLAHEALAARRISGEWFDVSAEEALTAVAQAMHQINTDPISGKAGAAGRNARARRRRLAAGYIRTEIIVYAHQVPEIREVAARLCREYEARKSATEEA